MARGDALFRQWELIKVLQAHRFGVSLEELCARLECNKRTVQRDLNVLQDIFPISHEQRDRGKRFWKLAHNTVESEQLQLTMPAHTTHLRRTLGSGYPNSVHCARRSSP